MIKIPMLKSIIAFCLFGREIDFIDIGIDNHKILKNGGWIAWRKESRMSERGRLVFRVYGAKSIVKLNLNT
jgi:hypothetical protein